MRNCDCYCEPCAEAYQKARAKRLARTGCADGHDWVPFKPHVGHPEYLHREAAKYEMCSRSFCTETRGRRA